MVIYDVKKIYEWPFGLRLIILSLCAMLILILIYLLDISSLKEKLISNDEHVEDLKRQLAMVLEKQVAFSNEISQLSKLKTIEIGWQKRMIDKSSFSGLLDSLLKLGESYHLKFTTFDPGEDINEGIYIKIPVKIIMKGTYDQIASFISQVVNMQRMIFIEDYSIIKSRQPGTQSEKLNSLISDDMLEAELILEIYRK